MVCGMVVRGRGGTIAHMVVLATALVIVVAVFVARIVSAVCETKRLRWDQMFVGPRQLVGAVLTYAKRVVMKKEQFEWLYHLGKEKRQHTRPGMRMNTERKDRKHQGHAKKRGGAAMTSGAFTCSRRYKEDMTLGQGR